MPSWQEAPAVKKLLKIKGIDDLWPTQTEALDAGILDSTINFVVIAPTASGKTLTAEFVIFQYLDNGKNVLYLVPSIALVSDKLRDFEYLNEKYNITSNNDFNGNLVISTFEQFYRAAILGKIRPDNFSLAIVDEFHILYDKLRGFNLEKVLVILLDWAVRTICLSATFEDKSELCEWLKAKLVQIDEKHRSTPLKHAGIDLTKTPSSQQNKKFFQILLNKCDAPIIVFCSTRDSARSRALQLADKLSQVLTEDSITKAFEKEVNRNKFTGLEEDLIKCFVKGVGFHHSGLHPKLRGLVESFFIGGSIKYVFATTGIAYGVNFPAKTVVVQDLTFYDTDKQTSVDIPVYLYLQMAGRAGRPQFGKEGFSYIVAKKPEEKARASKYIKGKLEPAISRISEDDYFRKALLELIYAGKKRGSDILSFFKRTFYNFQSLKHKDIYSEFDLNSILQKHINYLKERGFIEYMGVTGYELTDLGNITMTFLFNTFAPYELSTFYALNRLIEDRKGILTGFDLVYIISKIFEDAALYKPRGHSDRIVSYFEEKGIADLGRSEYSAYAIYYGWIENLELPEIERDFHVYASQLPEVAREFSSLIDVYAKLAERKGLDIPEEIAILKDRIKRGVREEELPVSKIKGMGRDKCRSIYAFSRNLKRQLEIEGHNILEILRNACNTKGEEWVAKQIEQHVSGVGTTLIPRVISVIRGGSTSTPS